MAYLSTAVPAVTAKAGTMTVSLSTNPICAGVPTASRSVATTARRSASPSLSGCEREAIAYVATTEGIKGEDVRDLIITAVESRFGQVNRLPDTIEWLSGNG